MLADSLAEAEGVARGWVAREPGSMRAQVLLAKVLCVAERYDEAGAVLRAATAGRDGADPAFGFWGTEPAFEVARIALAARRHAEADAMIEGLARVAPAGLRHSAGALRVASLRAQRRRAEALADAAALRRAVIAAGGHRMSFAQVEAQALLDAGRPRAAAARFDSLAALVPPPHDTMPGLVARARAWWGTQAAGALIDAGDTTDLARRIDSVAANGRRSVYGRDRRLHHYLRGRLWAARGDHARAVAEYEQAVYTPAYGYTRQNLMLARSLVALGRHDEALGWLRRAGRGDVVVEGTSSPERTWTRDGRRVRADGAARQRTRLPSAGRPGRPAFVTHRRAVCDGEAVELFSAPRTSSPACRQ
jgi:tetratricopeptide (TPR) repeat protein